jgi:hypothetical protein
VGSAYVKDGKFVVDKHPVSLTELLTLDHPFLSHMPYEGWTIAHLRAASHGDIAYRNTHPFTVGGTGDRTKGEGEWCIAHNGIWTDYAVAKLALSKFVKFHGETDTEVAAELINLVGPAKFAEEISWGGVYLCLNKSGDLWVAKTSGDLEGFVRSDKTMLLASALDMNKYRRWFDFDSGWYHYNKHGKHVSEKVKEPTPTRMYDPRAYSGHTNYCSPCSGRPSMSSIPSVTTPVVQQQAKPNLIGTPNGREWHEGEHPWYTHEEPEEEKIARWLGYKAHHD